MLFFVTLKGLLGIQLKFGFSAEDECTNYNVLETRAPR